MSNMVIAFPFARKMHFLTLQYLLLRSMRFRVTAAKRPCDYAEDIAQVRELGARTKSRRRERVRVAARSCGCLGGRGFFTVLTLRIFPIAPFTLVNLFVGASGIRVWDFFLASLIGRIPGILMLTLAGMQIENALSRPALITCVVLGLILILSPIATSWFLKRLRSATRPRRKVVRPMR